MSIAGYAVPSGVGNIFAGLWGSAINRRSRDAERPSGQLGPVMDFIDLKAQQKRIRKQIDAAIGRVLDHGAYILGPEVRQFEAELAQFGQSKLALSCANGTDAVVLPLMAWGVGPGDAVFCPAFTFAATAEVVPWTGATPVFVDILPDTYNLDPAHLEQAIAEVKAKGRLKPKAAIFG